MTIFFKLIAAAALAAAALVAATQAQAKALVVYFSANGPAMSADARPSGRMGSTQFVAYVIKDELGADIYRLETAKPYEAGDLAQLRAIARHEHKDNARPEMKSPLPDLSKYDTIYIGNPVWWHDYPMVFYTMFDRYDFAGKNLVAFDTSYGSGASAMVELLKKAEPGARVFPECLAVSGDTARDSADAIRTWLRERHLSVRTVAFQPVPQRATLP